MVLSAKVILHEGDVYYIEKGIHCYNESLSYHLNFYILRIIHIIKVETKHMVKIFPITSNIGQLS